MSRSKRLNGVAYAAPTLGATYSVASSFGALTAVSALGVTPTARAEGFPAHPVTIIVPFATGGPTDILARIMAEGMSRDLGQPVIIENTPGAGGTVGTARAARAAGLCRIGY